MQSKPGRSLGMRGTAEPWTLGGTILAWTAFSASIVSDEISAWASIILALTGIAATVMTIIVGVSKRRGLLMDNKIKSAQLARMERWADDKTTG